MTFLHASELVVGLESTPLELVDPVRAQVFDL